METPMGDTKTDPRAVIYDYVKRRGEMHWRDVRGHANNERSASLDYRGRLLFELLQNAVDRAEGQVVVRHEPGRLYFGNDGAPFSIWPEGGDPRGESDFHALCSINTSNKTAAGSIGNKGVGFKSVWEVASSVTIHARHAEETRWAFRLHHPLRQDIVRESADPKARELLAPLVENTQSPDPLPSFYLPEWISEPGDLPSPFTELSTVMVLRWQDGQLDTRVASLLKEFCQARFFFVLGKSEAQRLSITVEQLDESLPTLLYTDPGQTGWKVLRAADLLLDWSAQKAHCIEEAKELEFKQDDIALDLAFPPEGFGLDDAPTNDRADVGASHFYSYLPTEMTCGFSLLVHGDFYLENSRKTIDFSQPLNWRLAEATAEALLSALETQDDLCERWDVWRFLDPREASPVLRKAISTRLFTKKWEQPRFVALCQRIFSATGLRPARYYELFWRVMTAWKHQFVDRLSTSTGRANTAERKLWSALRRARVRCIPVVFDGDQVRRAVRLPDADRYRKRHNGNTVFFRTAAVRDEGEDGEMDSVGLFEDERTSERVAVTGWPVLAELWGDLKLTEFKRDNVVRELSAVVAWAEEEGLEEDLPHRQILCFLWELLAHPKNTGGETGFAPDQGAPDRLRQHQRGDRHLGADLARFRVPTAGGGWSPAGLTYDSSDERLDRLMEGTPGYAPLDWQRLEAMTLSPSPSDEWSIKRFLALLGVWACPPLVHSEGFLVLARDPASVPDSLAPDLTLALSECWSCYAHVEDQGLAEQLQRRPWFPLATTRNPAEIARAAPRDVWRVQENDRNHLAWFHKYAMSDLHLSSELLAALTIVPATSSATAPKVLSQLMRMRDAWDADPSLRQGATYSNSFRPRYRSMVLLLAHAELDGEDLAEIPLLCEYLGQPVWRGQPGTDTVWFYNRANRRMRKLFPDLCYAELDPSTPRELVRRLGIHPFNVSIKNVGQTKPDVDASEALHRAMPAFLSLVECVRIGGYLEDDFDTYLQRWMKTTVERGEDVYRVLTLGDRAEPEGKDSPGDVLIDDDRDAPRLLHDLKQPLQNLEAFAEAMATAVFRNPLYTEYFARVLDLQQGADEPKLMAYLESRGVSAEAYRQKKRDMASTFISAEEIHDLRRYVAEVIQEVSGRSTNPEDIDLFRLGPQDFSFPGGSDMTAAELNRRLPQRLAELGVVISCTSGNRVAFETAHRRYRRPVLVAALLADPGRWSEGERDALIRSYDQLTVPGAELDRLAFDPLKPLQDFLSEHGVPWQNVKAETSSLQQSDRWAQGLLLLEQGLRFSTETTARKVSRDVKLAVPNAGISPTPVRGQQARAKEQQVQAARGFSAEQFFATSEAVRLWDKRDEVWPVIARELKRLGDATWEDPCPESISALARALRVAGRYDGVGYDVLTVRQGALVRVEVKSAAGGRMRFFLSEPERARAQEYLEGDDGATWELRLYVEQQGQYMPYDMTTQVRKALAAWEPPRGGLQPVSYEVDAGVMQ